MKKIALLLVICVTLISCDKNNQKKDETTAKTDATTKESIQKADIRECLTLKEYRKCTTIPLKADWLRKYGAAVCTDTLDIALENAHRIAAENTPTTLSNPYRISWEDMEIFIDENMYNAYISFEYNDVKTVVKGIKLIPKFDEQVTCYSVPLIRHIAKENKLNPNDYFEFGKTGSNSTVFIKVKGVAYYDFSNEPKATIKQRYPI
jgi:hypothetical protein